MWLDVSLLCEGGRRKRRTAYSSGRRELLGFASIRRPMVRRVFLRRRKRDRLIARTPYAAKTWRRW